MAGCGCGGGGGKKSLVIKDSSTNSNMLQDNNNDLVLMEYIGNETGTKRLRSRIKPAERYPYSKNENRFLAYKGDVNWLISLNIFKVINTTINESAIVNDLLPLEANTTAPDFSGLPVDVLGLDPTISATLRKNGYDSVARLKIASDGELLALKGMGDKRLKDVRQALASI